MDKDDNLSSRLIRAAKNGMSLLINFRLSELKQSEAEEVLHQNAFDDDGHYYNVITAAAMSGKNIVIESLLNDYKLDLEAESTIVYYDGIMEGVTALWCACSVGHIDVVKTLVRAGADVNHATYAKKTPVGAACSIGRLDIVKYLISHRANIQPTNCHKNTCLIIATLKGYSDIVSCLLKHGANPNDSTKGDLTAVHIAARRGNLNILTELLRYGGTNYKAQNGLSPLLYAAERGRKDIVEFFIKDYGISVDEEIEALELLGASFANDRKNYDPRLAYEYLLRAMKLRYKDPEKPIKKLAYPPVAAYRNWKETQTVAELEAIEQNQESLQLEGLAVRERILGGDNRELPRQIIYRGSVCADNRKFDRCLELWVYACEIKQKLGIPTYTDFLRFAEIFSQMMYMELESPLDTIVKVLSYARDEQKAIKTVMLGPLKLENPKPILDEAENTLLSTLYILTIIMKIYEFFSDHQREQISKFVIDMNYYGLTMKDGQTLLHMACNADIMPTTVFIRQVCVYPCLGTVRLFTLCNTDVTVVDNMRNTPLHTAISGICKASDMMDLRLIVMELQYNGAHLDAVNCEGNAPRDIGPLGLASLLIPQHLNLKCLAAEAVATNKIPYKGQIPVPLEEFVEMHGRGIKKPPIKQ